MAVGVAECFWWNASDASDQPALWDRRSASQRFLTWGELGKVVAETCRWLESEYQLSAGSRIATQWPNSLAWLATDLACQTLGWVHVPFDTRESAAVVEQLVDRAGAQRIAVFPANVVEAAIDSKTCYSLEPLRHRAQQQLADAAAQLLATSGSTGCPKLVTLSHRNLASNARAKLDAAPQFATDLRLNILPFAHAYARTCELSAWIVSRSRLAMASDWDDLLELAEQLRPSLINLVPYLAEHLAGLETATLEGLRGCLRLLQVGGAALPDPLWQQLASLGWPPLQGYGLTEASPVVCSNRAGEQRPGTVGPAVAGTQLRIDEDGVLWLSGPQVMLGYWNDPQASGQVLDGEWLCTGDLAERDGDRIRILGRKSQLLVLSTGYNVSPELIERRLLALGDVEQAVVLGDGCPHITAWLWPRSAAGKSVVNFAAEASMPEDESWLRSVALRIAESCRDLPRHAVPRDLRLLPQPLSAAAGTLTRKGTPNRSTLHAMLRPV